LRVGLGSAGFEADWKRCELLSGCEGYLVRLNLENSLLAPATAIDKKPC
jgi:hypothetical protein